MILQQLVHGLTLGSLYALIALGYTIVYGILLMINFAHSEIFMLGAIAGWAFLGFVPSGGGMLALAGAFLVSIGGAGAAGIALDRLAYAPLRQSPRLTPLLSAI